MAEVYRAVLRGAAGFEKTVALKRILPFFGEDEDFVTLFQDEARIVSTLNHANIAQVFDFGEIDGSFYLTMELVEGSDLSRLTERLKKDSQPMPLPTAAFIIAEAARGLGYAHEKKGSDGKPLGIVHRDVSPHNVLISYEGEVKVTDFGIAKATGKAHKTATGVVMGKLRYMSPEQVAGDELDGRSDLFSLGVILYELLTGGPIFPGDQNLRLAELIHTATIPPPSTRNPAVPAALDDITLRALSRPKTDRHTRAADLARDLTVFVNQLAPGFSREDLGALVRRLAPPTEPDPGVPLVTVPPTADPDAMAPTLTPRGPLPTTPLRASTPVSPSTTTPARAPTPTPIPTPTPTPTPTPRTPDPEPRIPDPEPPAPPKRRRLSTEAWIGITLLGVILISATAVVIRFALPSPDAKPVAGPADAAPRPPDAARPPADAAPPTAEPFHLTPTVDPHSEAGRRLEAATKAHPVSRRGVPAEDYYTYLTAVDTQLAGLTLADDGTALPAPDLPAPIANAVARARIADPVAALVEYVRATGEVPRGVRDPLVKSFLPGRPGAVGYMTIDRNSANRLPAYSAAALAVWLMPDDPRRLLELAYANDGLDRWCDPPTPPQRHFAPILCERDALAAALNRTAGGAQAAAALEAWGGATAYRAEAAYSGGRIVVRDHEYQRAERAEELVLIVTLDTGATRPDASLIAGGLSGPLVPLSAAEELLPDGTAGTGWTLTFLVPRRLFAPVIQVAGQQPASLRLPPPLWGATWE